MVLWYARKWNKYFYCTISVLKALEKFGRKIDLCLGLIPVDLCTKTKKIVVKMIHHLNQLRFQFGLLFLI